MGWGPKKSPKTGFWTLVGSGASVGAYVYWGPDASELNPVEGAGSPRGLPRNQESIHGHRLTPGRARFTKDLAEVAKEDCYSPTTYVLPSVVLKVLLPILLLY